MKHDIKKIKEIMILMCSSSLGLGYIPFAPGTFGTLLALPIWWLCSNLAIYYFILIIFILFVFSVWISHLSENIYGSHDVGKITIDEVLGMLVSVVGVPLGIKEMIISFILFRFFDIVKPPPIHFVDKHVKGGLGVVLDDVVAGVFACICMHVLLYYKII